MWSLYLKTFSQKIYRKWFIIDEGRKVYIVPKFEDSYMPC